MQRSSVLKLGTLLIAAMLIFPVYAFVYSQENMQVSQTVLRVYGGIKAVQVTGSIPNEMGSSEFGFFGAVFWNPTSDIYQVTRIEFNASKASNRVFRGITQGSGSSNPTRGWVLNRDRKTVYLATPIIVQPHSAQEFFIRIRGNQENEAFQVAVRITANLTQYDQAYSTRQHARNAPFSVLWSGSGPTPHFLVFAQRGQTTSVYVSLQEDSGNGAIGRNGKLTIQLPTEFSDIQSIGGSGWGHATIMGNKIEVNNTVSVRESYITYAFRAVAPTYKGLYMINASFIGTLNERPVANFSLLVND